MSVELTTAYRRRVRNIFLQTMESRYVKESEHDTSSHRGRTAVSAPLQLYNTCGATFFLISTKSPSCEHPFRMHRGMRLAVNTFSPLASIAPVFHCQTATHDVHSAGQRRPTWENFARTEISDRVPLGCRGGCYPHAARAEEAGRGGAQGYCLAASGR